MGAQQASLAVGFKEHTNEALNKSQFQLTQGQPGLLVCDFKPADQHSRP